MGHASHCRDSNANAERQRLLRCEPRVRRPQKIEYTTLNVTRNASARTGLESWPSVVVIVTVGREIKYPPLNLRPILDERSYHSWASGFTTNVFVASVSRTAAPRR